MALVLAILCGCASSGDWVWHKDGASAEDLQKDLAEARRQATRASNDASSQRMASAYEFSRPDANRYDALVRDYMVGRGYRMVRRTSP